MQENTDIMQIGNVFQSANRENPNPGRVYDDKGLCPTLGTMQGGNREPMIVETTKVNYVDMTETVKVRKHEIDTKALSNLLRSHKTISNKEISKRLNVPITMVEHWFRRDDSSSVPSPELWFQLKKLLEIETDEFDKVITEFEERDGVFEKAARVYLTDSLSPTLTATATDEKIVEIKKMDENKMRESVCVGGFGEKTSNNGTQYYQQDRVYEMGDVSLTLPAQLPGGSYNYIDAKCVAMRGRNPENPSDRRKGIDLEQTLEINNDGIANTLTTVQKDNMVLIRQATKEGAIPCKVGGVADLNYPDSQTRRGRVQGNGEICPTLTTENIPSVLEDWTWEIDGVTYLIRIRKLTPKECWRLMGFSDEDFHKAEKVCSNSQLYKQAGNSIVTPVLEAIFKNLF